MKRIFTIAFAVLAIATTSKGQSNLDFETWVGSPEAPTNWTTLNPFSAFTHDTSVVKVAGYNTPFAAMLTPADLSILGLPPIGQLSTKLAITNPTETVNYINFFYKSEGVSDSASAAFSAIQTKWNSVNMQRDTLAKAEFTFDIQTDWKQAGLNFVFTDSINKPDSLFISVISTAHSSNFAHSIHTTIDQISLTKDVLASIRDYERNNTVNVFPTIANDHVFVNFIKGDRGQLVVYNTTGQVVLRENLVSTSNSIDVTGITNGIYIYNIVKPNGNLIKVGKLNVVH